MKLEERAARLSRIRAILKDRRVGSQDALIRLLRRDGVSITQATLSRDLKQLNAGKYPDGSGRYVYAVPSEAGESGFAGTEQAELIMRGFLSLEFSGNLGVVKTLPGFAGSVGSGLDSLDMAEILGTVAGDDTILLVAREGVSRQRLIKALVARVPAIKDKI